MLRILFRKNISKIFSKDILSNIKKKEKSVTKK